MTLDAEPRPDQLHAYQSTLLEMLIAEMEADIIQLRKDKEKLWSFVRGRTKLTDELLYIYSGVHPPQEMQ